MIKLISKAIGIILNNPYKFASKHKKNIFLGNSVLSRSFRVILNGDKNNLTIGNGSVLTNKIVFETNSGKVKIGDNTYIGSNTSIICRDMVTIGNNVQISWNVTIYDHDGNSLDCKMRAKEVMGYYKNYSTGDMLKDFNWNIVKTKPIVIEDDVWIGFNCIILKGVTIGKGSIVAAGSVVSKNVEPFTVVAGNPALIIKKMKNEI